MAKGQIFTGNAYWDYWHNNPPAPFNPHYNPERVKKLQERDRLIKEFNNNPQYDHLSDEEWGVKLNEYGREVNRMLGLD